MHPSRHLIPLCLVHPAGHPVGSSHAVPCTHPQFQAINDELAIAIGGCGGLPYRNLLPDHFEPG